jgi:hypothetical protein
VIYTIWVDGNTYQLTGIERGTSLRWETAHYPSIAGVATFYALSLDTNNRRNSYVPWVTPASTIVIPPPTLGPPGIEYCQNVTGFSVTVTYPATSDGTRTAQVEVKFTPPSDPRWGSLHVVATKDGNEYYTWGIGRSSPIIISRPELSIPVTYTLYGVSADVNGKINTIRNVPPNQTPSVNTIIGTDAAQLDLSKAKPTSYDPNIFVVQDGKFKVWAMNGSLIVTGSISSDKLNATEISVGGGGNKPGKFGVYNSQGNQIGFIGVEAGKEGGWFKTLRIGGANPNEAPFYADSAGNLSIRVGAGADYAELNQNSTVAPLVIRNASGRRIWFATDATYGTGIFLDQGIAYLPPWVGIYNKQSELHLGLNTSLGKVGGSITSNSVSLEARINNLTRSFEVKIDQGTTSYVILTNMGIKVDGEYEGQSVTINYKKADGSNGVMEFRRGILVYVG